MGLRESRRTPGIENEGSNQKRRPQSRSDHAFAKQNNVFGTKMMPSRSKMMLSRKNSGRCENLSGAIL